MTIFTKFGVWDMEVREFIDEVCSKTEIPQNKLSEWFYSDGVIIFHSTQHTIYRKDENDCIKNFNHRPIMTPTYMSGHKLNAFSAILPKLLEKFTAADLSLNQYITIRFNAFVLSSLQKHTFFNEIQANVTTQLNQFLDENPSTPKHEIFEFVVNKFNEHKHTKTELAQEIDDHLQLMKEFASYAAEQRRVASIFADHIIHSSSEHDLDTEAATQTLMQMLNVFELSFLIKIISKTFELKKDLIIVMDSTSDDIGLLSLGLYHGQVKYTKNKIYFAGYQSENGKENPHFARVNLLYGITQFIADIVFENKCMPYYVNDDLSQLKLDCIYRNIIHKQSLADNRLLENINDANGTIHIQLIARVTQLIWLDQGSTKLRKQYPELMDFYQKQFLDACATYLNQLHNPQKMSPHISLSLLNSTNTGHRVDKNDIAVAATTNTAINLRRSASD